jgi:hypothetical protein
MTKDNYKVVADNRRARFDYFIKETLEAGIMLTGTEVKSLREGRGSIKESHAGEKNGELFLMNAHIDAYVDMKSIPRNGLESFSLKGKSATVCLAPLKKKGLPLFHFKYTSTTEALQKCCLALQLERNSTIRENRKRNVTGNAINPVYCVTRDDSVNPKQF